MNLKKNKGKVYRYWILFIVVVINCVLIGMTEINNSKNGTDISDDMVQNLNIEESEVKDLEPELSEEEKQEQEIDKILADMTLQEKIYQLFIVSPEALTGYDIVTTAGEATKAALQNCPVGGIIYFSSNLIDAEQTKTMLTSTMDYAYQVKGIPVFLCIDEEGGSVARIGNNAGFEVEDVGAMGNIESISDAYNAGVTIGGYLSELGFNLDFAPDADVLTNSCNTVIGDRSFGSNPEVVSELAEAVSDGLHSQNIMSTFKHFPGHGATEADTHEGFAYTNKGYEELIEAELVPFAKAEEAEIDMVMVSHISVPQVIGDDTPCTLSSVMIQNVLRENLGYNGLVVTDAMNMGAIVGKYSADDATVRAILAGADIILMPEDFERAFRGIADAVEKGVIGEEQIEISVRRILNAKMKLMDGLTTGHYK